MLKIQKIVVLILLALSASAHAQQGDWQDSAKDVVNFTSDLLEKKVEGDKKALAGLKNMKEKLLTEKELAQLSEQLKEKIGTAKPDKDKVEELKTSIKKKIDKADIGDLKKDLEKGQIKVLALPWPFGKG